MAHTSDRYTDAVELLKRLIATPSLSREEGAAADVVESWLRERGFTPRRHHNNVWALAGEYDAAKPTLMLNSHIDTVKPAPTYTIDPFTPLERDGRLYGLGSNDAGASVVSLAAAFVAVAESNLPYNLLLALSAEEEVGGENGMRALWPHIADEGVKVDMALVGEPTGMSPAIAERGLIVLDCVARGRTGHAARDEGDNALYKALDDIATLRGLQFERVSSTLGPVKITVTQIEAGRQHNVVPDECRFVVDVRTTDAYSNEDTERLIQSAITSEAHARSYRNRASVIAAAHPLVVAAAGHGAEAFISGTSSDMAHIQCPSLKIGPGDSARSHSADEYICLDEIRHAIQSYIDILLNLAP